MIAVGMSMVMPGGVPPPKLAMLSFSGCGFPLDVAVSTSVVAVSPGCTYDDDDRISAMNSFAPDVPQTGCAIRHPPTSFDQVLCMANVPVANDTFATAPWPV